MKRHLIYMCSLIALLSACDYDEGIDTLAVSIRLTYPEKYPIGPYLGARVELQSAAASVFVDSTDAEGVAHFHVPPGVYSITSANTIDIDGYRYICNGTRGQMVIAPDSTNNITLPLSVTRRRIVAGTLGN